MLGLEDRQGFALIAEVGSSVHENWVEDGFVGGHSHGAEAEQTQTGDQQGIRNVTLGSLVSNLFQGFHWRNLRVIELGSVDPGFSPSPHTSPTPDDQGASPDPEKSSHSSSSRLQNPSQVLQ